MGLFDKFKIGLGKSSDGLSTGFKNIFSKKKIDENVLTEFEELIITSDAGVEVAKELRKDFENFKVDKKLEDHKEILKLIADKLAINLQKYEKDLSLMGNAKSAVIVVSGVNGVGKTTSIGKLGKYFKDNNRSVVFGAADTFRAAAIDQLQVWAAKVKVDIIKSEINSDPASVAFKTVEFAKKNEIDVALIDTAGRLQNKKNLMEEYKKIINVHPSLLPKYSGGMDTNVHSEVLRNNDDETGCTIHFVTEEVDSGPILVQKKCSVNKKDTISSLKKKVQKLEGEAFIEAIKTLSDKGLS